jgi:hypothetical protein
MSAESDAAIERMRAAIAEMNGLAGEVGSANFMQTVEVLQMSALISIAESLAAITRILPNVGQTSPGFPAPRRSSWG